MFSNMNFHRVKREKSKPFQPPDVFEKIPNINYVTKMFETSLYLNDTTYEDAILNDLIQKEQERENARLNAIMHYKEDISNLVGRVKQQVQNIQFVYQSFYKNTHATGFGDFIRGAYFILQFCEKFDFSLEIVIQHPIYTFLKNKRDTLDSAGIFSNIEFYDNIFKDKGTDDQFQRIFLNHLNSSCIVEKKAHIFTNAFTINDSISINHKNRMREILEPGELIQKKINTILSAFELKKQNYIIVHIRSGDSHLIQDEKISFKKIKLISREISNLSIFYFFPGKVLLLSDSLEMKKRLVTHFPFKCLFNEITHLGEGISLESKDEKILNTLVDFFLFGNAMGVFSFSFYEHGSGFSEWACRTYDVPYRCKYLQL